MAFTMVEMLVVIAIIGILAALLLPVLNRSEMRTKRVICINVQQQIGLAFHTFSNDHNGKFPMAISTNEGGSMEFVQSGFAAGRLFYTAYRHFQVLSNVLVLPRTLICPSETTRFAATNFPALQNENLSYFVGVNSTFDKPDTILAGDRNLVTNSFDQPTILPLGPCPSLRWTWELHQNKGNILYADDHVDQWNDSSMAVAVGASPINQSLLFLPTVVASELPLGSGPSGSSPPGSGGSGPTGPVSGQTAGSASGDSKMGGGSSSSPQGDSSASGQQTPWMPAAFSQSSDATETVSQAQAPDSNLIARTFPASGVVTDEVVSVEDTNSAMSPFDQHMTIVLQHSFGWFYLLLCILVLLYLLNRMRKRLQKTKEE